MVRTSKISQSEGMSTWRDTIELMRPSQWVKNVVVFAGPAAGLALRSGEAMIQAIVAFIAFCLAASAAYAINDAIDRKADASHPTKRLRPVARGAIKPGTAVVLGIVMFLVAVALTTITLVRSVTVVIACYFVMTVAYSAILKRRMILDVIIIALGFVLRAWAGSLAVGVATSEWLIACMFTLCLFMGFGKRRCELAMIDDIDDARQHRPTLLRYTPHLLNHLITVSAGIAVMTFLLYTLDHSRSPAPFPKEDLFFTLPIVVYGVFRFAMLSESGIYTGPTEIVLKDKAMLGTIVIWTAAALLIAYQQSVFGPTGIRGFFQWM